MEFFVNEWNAWNILRQLDGFLVDNLRIYGALSDYKLKTVQSYGYCN